MKLVDGLRASGRNESYPMKIVLKIHCACAADMQRPDRLLKHATCHVLHRFYTVHVTKPLSKGLVWKEG
jgi:hypothetical protein